MMSFGWSVLLTMDNAPENSGPLSDSTSVMRHCLIRAARSREYTRAIEGRSGTMIQKRAIRLLLLALLILAWLNLLERRLVESHAPVIIPFDDRVLFVRSLNCSELPRRLSEVAQTLDPISGIQFLVSGRGLRERWLLGTVCVRRCAGVG